MAWFRRHSDSGIPAAARTAIGPRPGERLLVAVHDDTSGQTVVAGSTHLYAVAGDEVVLDRPWHLVDAGSWDHDTFTLTVTWVDGVAPVSWVLHDRTLLPETLRERVQATVVLADTVDLGPRRRARVVVRRNLATGELVGQTLLGRGVRRDDPGVLVATSAALARLKERVGLD